MVIFVCFHCFRSDVLGQILPVVGQAWAQSGVVCHDKHLVSPNNVYTFPSRQVLRIQRIINLGMSCCCTNIF